MYWMKAVLCHRPRVWIVESSIPAAAAVVAAPILKLWPASWCCSRLVAVRISRIWDTKCGLVIALFAESTKNVLGRSPFV